MGDPYRRGPRAPFKGLQGSVWVDILECVMIIIITCWGIHGTWPHNLGTLEALGGLWSSWGVLVYGCL